MGNHGFITISDIYDPDVALVECSGIWYAIVVYEDLNNGRCYWDVYEWINTGGGTGYFAQRSGHYPALLFNATNMVFPIPVADPLL